MRFLEPLEECPHCVWAAEGERYGGIEIPAQLVEKLHLGRGEDECLDFGLCRELRGNRRDESHPDLGVIVAAESLPLLASAPCAKKPV